MSRFVELTEIIRDAHGNEKEYWEHNVFLNVSEITHVFSLTTHHEHNYDDEEEDLYCGESPELVMVWLTTGERLKVKESYEHIKNAIKRGELL